jgi:hypothetical protein
MISWKAMNSSQALAATCNQFLHNRKHTNQEGKRLLLVQGWEHRIQNPWDFVTLVESLGFDIKGLVYDYRFFSIFVSIDLGQ